MTSELPSLASYSELGVDFPGLVFELTHDSPSFTNIIRAGEDKPTYKVSTEYPEGKHPLTTVTNGSGEFLGSLEWRPVFADLVIFGDKNSKPQRLSSWMSCGLFKGQTVTFEDSHRRKYRWHGYTPWGDNPESSLKLYADDCPDSPIVTYVRPPGMTKTSEVRAWEQRPKLILQPRAVEIQDLAIVSWLFLEKARRVKVHVPLWF
ncbi:hypothetical protein SCHPADRAFT_337163 [Schizopora paradoxa]|uniref:DUF6593 domain-containing protein n=1 Tax=Schizopora paradoxa TaxID=27342 RepID=A0A0H2RQ10_9AGAM|nr:hypothetical protein SCHPADRAFT_337163 [Schizopora paradoxa]